MTWTCTPPLWNSYYRRVRAAAMRSRARGNRTGSRLPVYSARAMKAFIVAATALALFPRMAWAHHFMDGGLPQTFAQGLLSGLGHPVVGLDHAAFIVAAGFLLASVEGGMWGVLALIVGALLGAVLHLAGAGLPGAEIGVALSVILIGCLLVVRHRIGLTWLAGGLALAGVLHRYAYAESIFGAEAAPLGAYLTGFSLVQISSATASLLLPPRPMPPPRSCARLRSS